jgi:hypothetical protein
MVARPGWLALAPLHRICVVRQRAVHALDAREMLQVHRLQLGLPYDRAVLRDAHRRAPFFPCALGSGKRAYLYALAGW